MRPSPNDRRVMDQRPPSRFRRLRRQTIAGLFFLALIGCVAVGFALLRGSSPRTYRLRMVTDLVPLRQFLAEQIRQRGRRHHLNVVLSSKLYGSMEALEEVDSPSDLKLALVPGGVTAREYPTVPTVTVLTYEPLHLCVRPDLATKGIPGLRGKRINLGPATLASHHLSREMLEFAGLSQNSSSRAPDFTLDTISPEDLYRELGRIESLQRAAKVSAPMRCHSASLTTIRPADAAFIPAHLENAIAFPGFMC